METFILSCMKERHTLFFHTHSAEICTATDHNMKKKLLIFLWSENS